MSTGAKIMAAIDKALTAPEPAKGNTFKRQLPPTNREMFHAARAQCGKAKFVSKAQLDTLKELATRWNRCWQFELAHTPEAMAEQWNQQSYRLAEALFNGEPIDVLAVRSKAEFVAIAPTLLDASKAARRLISQQAAKIHGEIYRGYSKALETRLAELAKDEKAKAKIYGVDYTPSADAITLECVLEFLKRSIQSCDAGAGQPHPINALADVLPGEVE